MKNYWEISNEYWAPPDTVNDYKRLSLYIPAYVTLIPLPKNRDHFVEEAYIKESKKRIIAMLISELMGTEDWFEENQD